MLVDGHYRKYVARLQERLGEARVNTARAFEPMGFELFVEPSDGMFVWARLPYIEDLVALRRPPNVASCWRRAALSS